MSFLEDNTLPPGWPLTPNPPNRKSLAPEQTPEIGFSRGRIPLRLTTHPALLPVARQWPLAVSWAGQEAGTELEPSWDLCCLGTPFLETATLFWNT